MATMYCPSCAGELLVTKAITCALFDDVHYEMDFMLIAYCTECPLVSVVDREQGRFSDLDLSLSVVFDIPIPRWLNVDIPLLRGRKDS